MKTLFAFIFTMSLGIFVNVQNQYQEAILSAIETMNNNSESVSGLQGAANTFERISMNEANEWLPLYYASYSYILMSYQEPDLSRKDMYLDRAQKFLDKAFEIDENESELYVLQAFLYPSRITVDPVSRGMEYMPLIDQNLDKAINLNPDNPRSYFLRAFITLNLPEAMGGGEEAAKPIFELANEKFSSFIPATDMSPDWGKESNQSELDQL